MGQVPSLKSSNMFAPTPSPVVAVYAYKYLAASMTFIHRQLIGVSGRVKPIVLTPEGVHLDRFPFDPLVIASRSSVNHILSRAGIFYLGYVYPLAVRQRRVFAEAIKSYGVNLVHAHFGPSAIEIFPVAVKAGIPLVVTFHGFDASQLLRRRLYVRQLTKVLKHSDSIAVSATIARRLIDLGASKDRVHVHYIGVPLEKFPYAQRRTIRERVRAAEQITLLQVASLVEKKGHAYTLRAFKRLLETYSHCRLVLIGDGPLRAGLEALAWELGIRDRVDFRGQQTPEDVSNAVASADVFVHHSVTAENGDEEGIPTAIMEAMAAGLPIVSTYHAGIPEIVAHGVNGFLVAERDVTAYAECLVRLLQVDLDFSRMSHAIAREKLDMSKQNRRLAELYVELACARSRFSSDVKADESAACEKSATGEHPVERESNHGDEVR